jgi:hypothetical protein
VPVSPAMPARTPQQVEHFSIPETGALLDSR